MKLAGHARLLETLKISIPTCRRRGSCEGFAARTASRVHCFSALLADRLTSPLCQQYFTTRAARSLPSLNSHVIDTPTGQFTLPPLPSTQITGTIDDDLVKAAFESILSGTRSRRSLGYGSYWCKIATFAKGVLTNLDGQEKSMPVP